MARSYPYEVSEELLQELVRRILTVGWPEKIILFGSRASGEAKPDSDLDLLVIDADQDLWDDYREAIGRLGVPVDLIVETSAYVASWRNVPNHFLTKIVREGRVLYERAIDQIREAPPPRDATDHAREFIQLGDRDLNMAEWALQGAQHPVNICFNAQQAIEKYMKAIPALDGAEVPRTHELKELRELVAQSPRKLMISPRVDELSKFAVNGRYPIRLRADAGYAAKAVQLARGIREQVVRHLPKKAVP